MMAHDDLGKIREENEAEDTWRKYSRHVVADLLEGCAICGTIREKEHLARCRWCEDVLLLQAGRLLPAAPSRDAPCCCLLDLVGFVGYGKSAGIMPRDGRWQKSCLFPKP